jgi:hypothetical protein
MKKKNFKIPIWKWNGWGNGPDKTQPIELITTVKMKLRYRV